MTRPHRHADAPTDDSVRCGCILEEGSPDERATLPRPPDFRVPGETEARVWWRDSEYFVDIFDTDRVVAAAVLGGRDIYLNRSQRDKVDGQLLAHEYGHCLGYEHWWGSVMDPYVDFNQDGQGGESLRDISRDVFESLADARVIDWGTRRGRWAVTAAITLAARGHMSQDDVTYAITRAARGDHVDALWLSDFDGFGRDDIPQDQLPKGTFYQAGYEMGDDREGKAHR